MTGFLLLEDGTVFPGESVGAAGSAFGEAVFTTAMTGYQETVTDPSYAEQLVCFTAPMVGNYGVADAPRRVASARTRARALMREARGPEWTDWLRERGIVGLTGIDTRSLVLQLREGGADARRSPSPARRPVEEALAAVRAQPAMAGRALVAAVSTARAVRRRRARAASASRVVDYGAKRSIAAPARRAPAPRVTVYPHDVDADELAGHDGVLLSNGPGDPEPLGDEVRDDPRACSAASPVLGICLGHQLLGARHRPRDVQAPVRPPRREPPGARARARAACS